MTDNNNPYAAPETDVTPPKQVDTSEMALLSEPRKVSIGAGIDWIKQAWTLMRKNLGTWVLMIIAYLAFQIVFGFLPYIGDLASTLLAPVFTAGLLLAAKTVDFGGSIQFSSLFEGFKERFKPLLALGALTLAAFFLLAIVFGGAIVISTAMNGELDNPEQVMQNLFSPINIIIMLIAVVASIIVIMMFAYSTHLVALNQVPVFESLKKSFDAAFKNILPLFIYLVIILAITMLGLIPLGLGLLITMPLAFIASYISYKDIFLA